MMMMMMMMIAMMVLTLLNFNFHASSFKSLKSFIINNGFISFLNSSLCSVGVRGLCVIKSTQRRWSSYF